MMEQLKSVFKMPSRQGQLWALILLSAATMIVPYGIQGALSSGKTPGAINEYIWIADNIAWAIRAMVEGLVIAYIARTKASNLLDTIILWAAELSLVALITLTLGPTLYATLNDVAMKEALPIGVQWAWALGLASYMPLMVLGASYAYKVQPDDNEMQQVDSAEIAQLAVVLGSRETELAAMGQRFDLVSSQLAQVEDEAQRTQVENQDMQTRVAALEAQAKTLQDWQLLPPTAKAIWVAQHTNGDRPPAAQFAQALGVAVSTVSRAYKKVDDAKSEAGG